MLLLDEAHVMISIILSKKERTKFLKNRKAENKTQKVNKKLKIKRK